jgi:acyl-CoA thioesterase I
VPIIARYVATAILVALLGCRTTDSGQTRGRAAVSTAVDDTSRAAASAAKTATAVEPVIMFVGTSLTAGLGVEPDQAYPARIQQKLDSAGLHYHVVNAGVSGETSSGALHRVDWLLREPVAVLVLETGANDGLRGQDPDSIRANIQAFIDRVHVVQPATQMVLVGMYAMPNLGRAYVGRFEKIYPALAQANRLPMVPSLLRGVAGVDSLNQADGIHPTPAGHRILAENVWQTLRPLLVPSS